MTVSPTWSGYRDAEEIAESLGITVTYLLELVDSGYIPHYRIDGRDGPAFKVGEVKAWAQKNMLRRSHGRNFPDRIRVVSSAPKATSRIPASIASIDGLQEIPAHDYNPGVYFLCLRDEVVYVGQTVAPAARLAQHAADASKHFDRVFLLPVPASDMNDVEAALIRALRPRLNGKRSNGTMVSTTPSKATASILAENGIPVSMTSAPPRRRR